MTRALAMTLLLALAGTARAEPRPTLAIVIDPKDREAVKTADVLAAALRKLSAGKAERFRPKPTDKDIAAATRSAECKAVEPACAVKLGTALGVDYVLSGELESRGKHLVLVVGLVNVSTKQRVRSLRDTVASALPAKQWAQKVYERVVSADTGELTVVANARQGEILIDGQVVGALFEGRATLTGLAVGPHELGIRAPGYRPLDVDVTIDGTARENLLLEPAP